MLKKHAKVKMVMQHAKVKMDMHPDTTQGNSLVGCSEGYQKCQGNCLNILKIEYMPR